MNQAKWKEECGVFGVYSPKKTEVARTAYTGLYALQHRGQESCGIVINDAGVLTCRKGLGLVSEVFQKEQLSQMGQGRMAIGHVRYGTTGEKNVANAQPLMVNHVKGSMALAHNGNLTNAAVLREKLELEGAIFHTTSDTEVIAYMVTKARLTEPSIEDAVCKAMEQLGGAYSLVIVSPQKLIAARDPLGFRPLCIGKWGDGWCFASETCALDSIGAEFVRDVEPGEIVVASEAGLRSIKTHCGKEKKALCVFELIYFARPDSVIDGISIHEARKRAGAFLAQSHPVEADVVVGVPDSGLDAALGYAQQSGIPYGVGFIKNKYIGRTFIQPTQSQRERDVRLKLNPIASAVKGKRVVLIDDSIVRGTTSARIVGLLRAAGAKEVHMRVSAPPFRHPCYFGTDIDSRENLIACRHTISEIAQIIGADSLGFLGLDQVTRLAEGPGLSFCSACFSGQYPVPVPAEKTKYRFEQKLPE
jgi:amidophosphoribosyltransferase